MPESNFDIDRLGMLTLEHFENSIESDSSCSENSYSNSELSSNASSPLYFTEEFENPVCSATEQKSLGADKCWKPIEKEVQYHSDCRNDEKREKQPTCRYRRGRRGKETVSKRNERERRRVRLISEGFCELRKRLMIKPYNRKLPKLQILRKAISYIKNLEEMITESDLQKSSVVNEFPACHTSAAPMQMAYRYNSSYTNKKATNMQINYVNISALQRRDFTEYNGNPEKEIHWLPSFQM